MIFILTLYGTFCVYNFVFVSNSFRQQYNLYIMIASRAYVCTRTSFNNTFSYPTESQLPVCLDHPVEPPADPATALIKPGVESTIEINKDKMGLGLSIVGGSDTLLVIITIYYYILYIIDGIIITITIHFVSIHNVVLKTNVTVNQYDQQLYNTLYSCVCVYFKRM